MPHGKARCDSAGAGRVGAVVPLVKRPRLAPAARRPRPFRMVGDLAEGGGRIDSRRAEGAAPATVNRETQLLGQALRLGLRRGKLAGPVPEIRRLREDNARQGFFEAGAFGSVVANLPDHLQDVARFG